MLFKISMFNLENVEKYSKDLIHYRGHLPYYVMAVLGMENVRKRYEYLKGVGDNSYDNELKLLKSERQNNTKKVESLREFLNDNPQFRDIVQKRHLKTLLQ